MFITFEGIDGAGKSTQAALLCGWLRENKKRDVLLTKEPGGWSGGELLRDMAIDGKLKHPWSEAYLFMRDRAEHVASVISPALESGKDIVCERYHDSTLAYQVWGRGLPLEIFVELAKLSAFPEPDMTILFDIAPELALKRVGSRGSPDSFEKEGLHFMSRVREGYLKLSRRDPRRWLVLDCGEKTGEEIFDTVIREVCSRRAFFDI